MRILSRAIALTRQADRSAVVRDGIDFVDF
jgi:hypothetical protein